MHLHLASSSHMSTIHRTLSSGCKKSNILDCVYVFVDIRIKNQRTDKIIVCTLFNVKINNGTWMAAIRNMYKRCNNHTNDISWAGLEEFLNIIPVLVIVNVNAL